MGYALIKFWYPTAFVFGAVNFGLPYFFHIFFQRYVRFGPPLPLSRFPPPLLLCVCASKINKGLEHPVAII